VGHTVESERTLAASDLGDMLVEWGRHFHGLSVCTKPLARRTLRVGAPWLLG
jgi:hypothetical protein